MKTTEYLSQKINALKEKYSKSRGKGKAKTETQIFNHPRKDKAVRSGKK